MAPAIYRHLRIGFMVAWVVAWNALLGIGLLLDLQTSSAPSTYFGVMVALAALSTSLLCLALLYVPRLQASAFRMGTSVAVVRRELWFLAALTGILGLASAAGFLAGH